MDITLSRQEEALIARAVPKRRNEFTTVRACAHDALAGLGLAPVPLLPDERGAPGWPPGVVGSMTHCPGYGAAAVPRLPLYPPRRVERQATAFCSAPRSPCTRRGTR
ncbi:4'-phosphopantetheinyl transferase [Streptomyces sp. KL109B]|nr:hypothetical protein [Streptomyces sp. KL109B]